MEWVSVEDRLPEDSFFVDVYIKSNENPNYGRRKISTLFRDGEFDAGALEYREEYISHWMKVEPPKEK